MTKAVTLVTDVERMAAVAARVRTTLAEAPVTGAYRAALIAALQVPGNALSATPNARWARPVWTCCETAGGEWGQAVVFAAAMETFLVALDLVDDFEDHEVHPDCATLDPSRALNVSTGLLLVAQQGLLDHPAGMAALRLLLQATLQACSGQHADLTPPEERSVDLETALAITAQKSGSLVSVTCRLGALAAYSDDSTQLRYVRFGALVGVVAQLANDIAAVNPAAVKTDIALHRPTLPLCYTAVCSTSDAQLRQHTPLLDPWSGGAAQFTWVVA
jgi:geranylgeranyl pyrophosphate synthase